MKAQRSTHAFIGVDKCGHALAICVDDGDHHSTEFVLGILRDGLSIDRLATADAKARFLADTDAHDDVCRTAGEARQ